MERASDIARFLFFAAIAFLFPRFSFADTLSTGWTWSMACPVYGDSTDTGNFTSTQTSGFSGSGNCQRANNFTEVSFTASSGATLRSTNYFALQTPGVMILPPVTTADQQPIFMVATACPLSSATLNWIFVQWDSVGSNALTNTYVLGTATYSSGAGVNVTSQYDINGAAYWLGTSPMPGTCSSGVYNVTALGDLAGTVFFNSSGQGVFKTNLGHATFFFPQYTMTLSSDLGNKTFIGMTFDSTSGTDSRNVQVTSNAAGTIFSVQLLSNPATGTIDNTYADTITVSQANTPVNGMLLGTVTRTGAGAGSGKIACIVNNSSVGVETICSGQSPSASTTPYNISFTHLVAPPTMVSINVTPASPSIPNGLGQQLTATAVFSDDSIENVTSSVVWSTNASGVATANSAGYVSSVALGSATITATLGSILGTAAVTVGSPVLVSVLRRRWNRSAGLRPGSLTIQHQQVAIAFPSIPCHLLALFRVLA